MSELMTERLNQLTRAYEQTTLEMLHDDHRDSKANYGKTVAKGAEDVYGAVHQRGPGTTSERRPRWPRHSWKRVQCRRRAYIGVDVSPLRGVPRGP